MAKILYGKPVASALLEKIRPALSALAEKGVTPTLAIVRVGEKGGDITYERAAVKRCEGAGVSVKVFSLPENVSQAELINLIHKINNDCCIHGCLLLRPLPAHIDDNAARNALLTEKDVDGITDGSLAGVFTGINAGFPPCTAQACLELLEYYGFELNGKNAVVIGRSLVIGKPVAMMLLGKNATVTVCHSKTMELPRVCREADIVIAAAGSAGIVNSSFLSPKQIIIDVGINLDENGHLCGDVLWEDAQAAEAATPVPGGVGTITTAVLVKHVIEAAAVLGGLNEQT